MLENPPLDRHQGRARIEPEFLSEEATMLVEGRGELRPGGRHVQRNHQSLGESLAQGVFVVEHLDLGHDLGRPTQGEFTLEQQLVGDEAQLGQALGLGLHPILVVELGVGTARAQKERGPQRVDRTGQVDTEEAVAGVGQPGLEDGDIEAVIGHDEPVAGRSRLEVDRGSLTLDHPPDPGDIASQGGGRPGRRQAGEHGIDQPIG